MSDESMPWESTFRRQMAERRTELGLTQSELARRLRAWGQPWHQTSVAKIESGDRAVRLNEAFAIASELGVSLDWMIEAGDLTSTLNSINDDAIASAMALQRAAGDLIEHQQRLHAALAGGRIRNLAIPYEERYRETATANPLKLVWRAVAKQASWSPRGGWQAESLGPREVAAVSAELARLYEPVEELLASQGELAPGAWSESDEGRD